MNSDTHPDWSVIPEATFLALLDTFDYRRTAYGNVIEYREHPSGRLFATEEGRGTACVYRVHPGLV